MKNLKYMLFIFLFCCVNIAPVLAKEELMKCEYNKLYLDTTLNLYNKTEMADRKIALVDTNDANKYKSDSLSVITIGTRTNEQTNKDANTGSNNNESISCVYGTHYSNVKVNCVASSSSLACDSDLAIMKNSLNLTDFKSNNNLACPATIGITVNENGVITDVSLSGGTDQLKLDEKASTGNVNSNPVEEPDPTLANEYENDERYQQAKADADKYCDATNFVYQDDAKCAEAREKMNEIKEEYANKYNEGGQEIGDYSPKAFCQRKEVKGTFRAIGWIIFISKILVPILLIVLGTIDVSKAVIASKDDEIKKSFKTLAIRAIAGVIIFFIPTIVDFTVTIFGGNDVYNENSGSFGYCTHCVLNPTDETCGNLMGGN